MLRLGGNASEFAYWKPTPGSPEPGHPPIREVEGEPKAQYYAVTSEAVRNLAGFLKATGWTCLYGIGMGTNTPARAAEEAGVRGKNPRFQPEILPDAETRWTYSAVIMLKEKRISS